MPKQAATTEELQRAHDRARRVLPPLPVALAKPALRAVLELGAAIERKPLPRRHDPKQLAAGDPEE